ncbi:alpha/beta fold hydrolase [Nocardioides sp. NPDC051685]|uniref:alpha/beta fold hydrolase n=1 Tax=Nocardioides sp. NPDC051685 TaxID=3364334 RepID=UPI0037885ACD
MSADRRRLKSYSRAAWRFDVVDTGPLDGEVIVLLHGFPQRATEWAKVMRRLNIAGYRTIAPDQRGYSPGARPRGRYAYRMSELSADVAELIATIDAGPVHLVGHDWGASISAVVAARYPEHVKSLTSISVPHPSAYVHSILLSTQLARSWYFAFFQLPVIPEFVLTRLVKLREWALARTGMDSDMLECFATEIIDGGALRGALAYYRGLPFVGRTPKVCVPTTHVWSSGETLLVRRGATLNARYVQAPYELAVLDGVSHWVPDHAPAALADIVVARARSVAG